MIKSIARWLLKSEINELNGHILSISNDCIESQKLLKECEFNLKIAKMYIDDDDALFEVIEINKISQVDPLRYRYQDSAAQQAGLMNQSSLNATGQYSGALGMFGSTF